MHIFLSFVCIKKMHGILTGNNINPSHFNSSPLREIPNYLLEDTIESATTSTGIGNVRLYHSLSFSGSWNPEGP